MIYYVTFNDVPNGIYQSQVIDVVKYLSELSENEVKLIAFLPFLNFKENKKKIKSELPSAKVFPIFAGITRWRKIKSLLKLVTKRDKAAICRGPIATDLALGLFKKVVYDGRAAVKAEVEEFDVTGNEQLGLDFIEAEKKAVLQTDYRIAVSNKLVAYWESEFRYTENNHVVIPCTLTSKSKNDIVNDSFKDIVKIVYSGGTGPWQSFDLVTKLIRKKLQSDENVSVLFLTKANQQIDDLITEFPDRCERKWLKHEEVFNALSSCDYGILIRNQNITNQVASPVKFAEYLNVGLKVLISENLGDFTAFVKNNDCGKIISDEIGILSKMEEKDKERMHKLAVDKFFKSSGDVKQMYLSLLSNL